tara:strand:- start:6529 stop:7494 length:966 start_codon:yes stop_codon:yes gene_type:complete
MLKKITKKEYIKMYSTMLTIRRFEERAANMYGRGLIGGFCHLYIGQEAVVVGILMTIQSKDTVVTTYRDHGHMIARGLDPKKIMAELTGRIDGYSKGKGGSMHMFSKKQSFYGGHGIVGAQVPVGTGIAFAHKYKNEKQICRTYIGDGAMNNGQIYESFNMASLWKLPVLYIIENNQYGMGTSITKSSSGSHLYKRGEPFGIPGTEVDGMDVLKVREASYKAAKHVRSGKGPYIIEMKTYRYKGHSMSDPAQYRTKKELHKYKEKDPIEKLKKLILRKKILSNKQIDIINSDIMKNIKEAAEFAEKSPLPSSEVLYQDVFA